MDIQIVEQCYAALMEVPKKTAAWSLVLFSRKIPKLSSGPWSIDLEPLATDIMPLCATDRRVPIFPSAWVVTGTEYTRTSFLFTHGAA